ncbi:sigma factor-like helix-turn-helix DNA-binding protein [Paraburkholderia antibiotica]|uniref:RNA polymerase subunit sigma n=1 Tax=Paraburkholderia antibiotica TaxID=2728839 RepID=A0A7X9X7X2_9BURK|nr:sigma factor-like helix-turn-helix DNA-binding protein [Paraburkholderia antibiotica]NML33045.1 RNA polymerase subunit sigma [Paraburkholderia antibiotica]
MTTTQARSLHSLYAGRHDGLLGWLCRQPGDAHPSAALSPDNFADASSARHAGTRAPRQPWYRPRAWLPAIARRRFVAQAQRRSLERSYLDVLASRPELHAPSEQERAQVLASLRHLDALLQRLSAPVRATLLLSQLDGLSHERIADHLAVSVCTVQRYLATAFEECLGALHDQHRGD